MDIVRLRTMTLRSKFNEGRYEGLTVEQVMKLGKMKLQNIYYNETRVTFSDDVLALIGIKDDQRIEKPGKNPELFEKIMRGVRFVAGGKKAFFANYQRKKRYARERARRVEADNTFTKGQMQWQNVHGKF